MSFSSSASRLAGTRDDDGDTRDTANGCDPSCHRNDVCGDAVVHILQPAIRDYYNLEEIWGGKIVRLKSTAAESIASKTTARRAPGGAGSSAGNFRTAP